MLLVFFTASICHLNKNGMFVVQVISRLRLIRNKKFEKILNLYKCLYRPFLN